MLGEIMFDWVHDELIGFKILCHIESLVACMEH